MKKIIRAISNILEAGGSAFLRYPAAMICAFGVAVTSSIILQLNGNIDNKLFDCLITTFVFGAVLNAAVVVSKERMETHNTVGFVLDMLGIFLPIAVFLLLYLPYDNIPEMSLSRVKALIIISAVMFILVPSFSNEKLNFNKMVFLILKSFFIAFIYCLVLLLGLYFIAFSVQSLLYSGLDSKIYGHIAIFTGLISYSLFLGYLPSFSKSKQDENLEGILKMPVFIEILLSYIIIPLLTVTFFVLAIWSAKILWWHNWPPFEQFNTIFSTYLLFGIFIFVLISKMQDSMSRFYRRFFPLTSLPLLALQAFNIFTRISKYAFTDSRYFLTLIWLFCTISIVVFILRPVDKNYYTAITLAVLAIIAVLPFFNYKDFSVSSQVVRTEFLLKENNMLEAGSVKPNPNITNEDKTQISVAVRYITTRGKASMAPWLNEKFNYEADFKNVFGFDPLTEEGNIDVLNKEKISYIGNLAGDFYSIDGYNILITPQDGYLLSSEFSTDKIAGKKGSYIFQIKNKDKNGVSVPVIILKKDDRVVVENDLYDYLSNIKNYLVQKDNSIPIDIPVDMMTYKINTPEVKVMIVFKTISVDISSSAYIKEEYSILVNNIFIAG